MANVIEDLLAQILFRLGKIELAVNERSAPAAAVEAPKKKKKSVKKPATGVTLFFRAKKPELAAANPGFSGLDIWGLAKKNFAALPQEEKDKWEEQAKSEGSVSITEVTDATDAPEADETSKVTEPKVEAVKPAEVKAPTSRRRTVKN